jgi:hypothetical protein
MPDGRGIFSGDSILVHRQQAQPPALAQRGSPWRRGVVPLYTGGGQDVEPSWSKGKQKQNACRLLTRQIRRPPRPASAMVTTRAGTSIQPVMVAHDDPSIREPTAPAPAAAQPLAGVPEKGRRRSGRLAALGDISNRGIAKRDAAKRGADGSGARVKRRGSLERRSSSASTAAPAVAAPAAAERAAPLASPPQHILEVDVLNAGNPQHMVPYMREIQECYSRTEVRECPAAIALPPLCLNRLARRTQRAPSADTRTSPPFPRRCTAGPTPNISAAPSRT